MKNLLKATEASNTIALIEFGWKKDWNESFEWLLFRWIQSAIKNEKYWPFEDEALNSKFESMEEKNLCVPSLIVVLKDLD